MLALACDSQSRTDGEVTRWTGALVTASLQFQDGVAPAASYRGTRDTTLIEQSPTSTSGTALTVRMDGDDPGGTGKDLSALLRFDITQIPSGSVVDSATLTLDVTNPSYGPYSLFEVKRDWVETEATWQKAAAATTWQAPGAQGSGDRGSVLLGTLAAPTIGTVTLALNAAGLGVVQRWVNQPSTNLGIAMAGAPTDGLAFSSREATLAASRPRLTIAFHSVAVPDAGIPETRPPDTRSPDTRPPDTAVVDAPPPPPPAGQPITLVPAGSVWRYLDRGTDPGASWTQLSFDDSSWPSGPAQLGYGDGDEATVVGYGSSSSNKYITTHFRRRFTKAAGALASLTLKILRDDGAVVYLNGAEIHRTNMPAGAITIATLANGSPSYAEESMFFDVTLNPALAVDGDNVLAVEIHQVAASSSDISFDLALNGVTGGITPPPPPPPPAGSRRERAARVDNYMINYGTWSAAAIDLAKSHQLVIADAHNGNLTRSLVAQIQAVVNPGIPDDDVLVLCYISIGEDSRSHSVSDAQARTDPRFTGDRTGPRVDPRGPAADGQSLAGIDPRGAASPGGNGYASYYLDDNSVDRNGVGDGIPDRNAIFGSYFVNAGDPAWFDALDNMTLEGPDGIAGLKELLTTTTGRGLGCDGVFLDTVDTAAPNSYTDSSSWNQSEFEWTAPGFLAFINHLRAAYPDRVILQNRGLFFFHPNLRQYPFTTRDPIDLLLFESYRLDSSSAHEFDPYFYPDNRYNYAPKIMAEANRPDGFRVLSLGYAEGPADKMSHYTLFGLSDVGLASLLEDIRVTQEVAGFRHYITDASVSLVNSFVRDHGNLGDAISPIWTSTYNDHAQGWPTPAAEATPRVGIQEVVTAGAGALTVRWDVALDMNRVGYALYYQTSPFDFSGNPSLTGASRIVLTPSLPTLYLSGVGAGRYPYESTISGLVAGQSYYLVIRAFDASPAHNEDRNTTVLVGQPL